MSSSSWQAPSVGRVVHYVSHGTPLMSDGTQVFPSTCRAALITDVEDEETVSLCVVNPNGLFFNSGCLVDNHEQPDAGTWHWPERV